MFESLTTQNLERSAEMLKALAHPLRLAILDLLKGRSLTVSEIHHDLGIEQAVASHHLAILRNKGLLGHRKEGKNSIYFLKYEQLTTVIACIQKCHEISTNN